MNRLTTFLLALLLITLGANAQTIVHECEAEFSDWSITSTTGTFQRNTWSTEADASGMRTPFIEYWVGSGSVLPDATISHKQLTGLETGYYEVSIVARAFNENSTTAVSEGITFTANDESVDLTKGTEGVYDGVSEEFYYTYNLLVYVEEGTLDIGFTIKGLTACDWMAFKNLEVTYLGDSPVGYAAHQCEAMLGHWTIDQSGSNGDFHLNTWSTEADPSGMVTPLLEYWIASGSTLSPATISHETITGLTAGYYEVSIDIRIFSEAGNEITVGGTLTANSASENLLEGSDIHSGTYGTETLVYGTCHLLAEVTEAGTLNISIVIPENVPYNWISFKNLKVVYSGAVMPTLEYVTGDMNADVEAAMKAAVDAYNSSKDADDYTAALAAIAAAEESVAQYAEIAGLVAALDTDGAAVWATTASGIAYSSKSLTTYDDYSADMAAAQIAQTTEGSDMSYALIIGSWAADQGNGPNAYNTFATETYIDSGEATSGKVLYYTVEGLQQGTYTVTFYAAANMANNVSGDTGSDISVAYANNATSTTGITVGTNSAANITSLDNMTLYSVTCTVIDGTLEFGIQNVADGGNWFLCAIGTLTLESLTVVFEPGDVAHSCEAEFDHWSISDNTGGSFQRNTWSSEADPSGMVPPFIEYWVGSGNQLSDATISHTQLTDLQVGYYEVSIFARAFNENSLVDVSEGITFNANNESIDLNKETHATYDHVSAEEYGTYKVYCYVDEYGTLDIDFTLKSVNCDWLAFKNLAVTYMGSALTDLPTLTAETGTMNMTVEEKQAAALEAYAAEGGATLDNYNAAYQAVECARVSITFYASIAETLKELNLDEAGKAAFSASEEGAAYEALTLTYCDMTDTFVEAVKAQTYPGSDMTYALLNSGEWIAPQGNGPAACGSLSTATETYCDGETNTATTGEALYKTIDGLTPGKYTVTFYAAANLCNEVSGASGSNLSQVYANDATKDITVGTSGSVTWADDYLYTLTCTVGENGKLEFGITNIASPCGNWYLAQEVSLTLVLSADVKEGDVVHDCTADLSHWTQTFTSESEVGTFELNTWSGETDASGMVTPYLQTWVYGDVISDQTIDHNQLTDLPHGWYSVTIDARIMSETGETITGTATLTANNDYIYIISDGTDGTYGTETEEYGTYTVQCYVDEDGTLDIGFTIKDANYNWFAWKNLSVVYLGETVEYNVGEATASTTYVQPGQTVTLTFADCTKGDEGATLGVSSTASVTFGITSVTLAAKGTITFTFEVPEDVESGEYTLTIPQNTIVWTLEGETKAGNAAQAITFIVYTTIDDGEYLIVDADGNYLGGGLTWGTQAAIIGKPQFIGFEQQENGTYHLDSHQYNDENSHYLGANLYFDNATPVDWALIEVEGGYAIYGTVDGGTGYLTSNGFQTVPTVEVTPYVWTLVTMDDVIASMDEATAEAPVDVTALIASPEMKRNSNTTYYPTWTVTGFDGTGTPSNYAFGGGSAVANCAESYHSTNGFNFSQEITLPLAGTYTLSAQGFYRDDDSETLLLPVMYAGDATSTFPELDTSANTMAEAYAEFLEGLHQIDAITITATSDEETVTIGFKGEDTSFWNIMGELELQYLGVVEETIEWEMTSVEWGTLILPFAADIPTATDENEEATLTVYTCTGLEDNETTLILDEAETIEACTPYLVSGTAGTYTFTGTPINTEDSYTEGLLVGTLVNMSQEDGDFTADSGQYVLQNHEDEGLAFYQITSESSGVTLNAYHCYLTYTGAEPAALRLPGMVTGIEAVENDVIANDAIYDLSGRKVSKAVKGVYIVNGKKVLVK